MKVKLDPKEKIHYARIKMQDKYPFFSYLSMHLNIREQEGLGSMGVDYTGNVWYDPEFVNSVSAEQMQFIIAHEVMHLGLEHLVRQDNRNERKWNKAADYAINAILSKNGMEMPPSGLLDEQYFDMSAEQIYSKLPNHEPGDCPTCGGSGDCQKCDGTGDGDDGGDCPDCGGSGDCPDCGGSGKATCDGDCENCPYGQEVGGGQGGVVCTNPNMQEGFDVHMPGDQSDQEAKDAGREWKDRLSEAAEYAKQRGEVPAGMEELIEGMHEARVNWKTLLRQFITNMIQSNYTWLRPSKKSWEVGSYLPSTTREYLDIAVAMDTSGSVSHDELVQFKSEINSIARQFENINITIIMHDAAVQEIYEIGPRSQTSIDEIKAVGRGGTNHKPVFEWINENLQNNQCLVCLTDGYSSFPDNAPRYKTIWVLNEELENFEEYGPNIPFGEIIHMY